MVEFSHGLKGVKTLLSKPHKRLTQFLPPIIEGVRVAGIMKGAAIMAKQGFFCHRAQKKEILPILFEKMATSSPRVVIR